MSVIQIKELTKDFGGHKGVFDLNMSINSGEIYGFLGPNGAGKTTTIRHLLGFIQPDKGSVSIFGKDCFHDAKDILKHTGYLAGEIAFPDASSGLSLLNFLADMKGITDRSRMNELIERFSLDTSGRIKKMSKGMKQKIGIINAFMGNPKLLILDEPTSGLDPLMQEEFIKLLLEEKKKGTTILMSSHIFEEVERTCDRTAIIRQGSLVAIESISSLQSKKEKTYQITLDSNETANSVILDGFTVAKRKDNCIYVNVNGNIPALLAQLSKYPVQDITIHTQTLEQLFLQFYHNN